MKLETWARTVKPALPPPSLLAKPHCVYCGCPLTGPQTDKDPPTCGQHADLPARDPVYLAGAKGAAA